jgi:hypothetical protein
MAERPFDPTRALRFDVQSGSVIASGDMRDMRDMRVVLIPAEALAELAKSDLPGVIEGMGNLIGRAIGKRLGARLGASASSGTVESFVTEMAGELGIAGYGAVSVERWGHALIVVVEGSALPIRMLAPLIGAAIENATGREVWSAMLMHDERTARVLVSSRSAIARVRDWLDEGIAWGVALTRLHVDARDKAPGAGGARGSGEMSDGDDA